MTTEPITNPESTHLEAILATTEDPVSRVDLLNEIANRVYHHEPERALNILEEAITLALANNYGAGYVHGQMQQVHIRNLIGDLPSAVAQANQILTQDLIPLTEQQSQRVQRKLAILYAELGDYVRALTTLHDILRQEIARGNQEGQAHTQLKIGNIYSYLADPERALDCYQAALEMFIELGDDFYTAVVYNSYCVDYAKLGRYELAEEHGLQARALFTTIDDEFGIALAESSLGEVATARQEYARAADHFARAISAFANIAKSADAVEMLETRLNLGHALTALGNLKEAQKQAELVLQQAQAAELRPLARQAHELLARVHEAASRPWDALHHLKQFVTLNEALFSEKAQREIQNLKIIHETEQTQAELEQQRRLREQDKAHYERLARIKDEFVHNVTHDIKNPLSIIDSSIYMLKERFLAEEPAAQRILDTINRQLSKILTLVEEMLELAKLEAIPDLQRENIALASWLGQLAEMVQPLAENKEIRLTLSVEPPDLRYQGDRQRLEQALENLLTNAIKYTPPAGQVSLRARQIEQQLEIRIQDTGIGIPPEALAHIFDRFYRVENNTGENEGSGLGLNVAKIAVEQHGGVIHVASEVNCGTTFSILLPLF
ncbi:MAG: tetratricopeptide repeat protein [Anaerolineales bacterium]|nr:tetratricopeptide repeat protein [Anaerolineales bacterium]